MGGPSLFPTGKPGLMPPYGQLQKAGSVACWDTFVTYAGIAVDVTIHRLVGHQQAFGSAMLFHS